MPKGMCYFYTYLIMEHSLWNAIIGIHLNIKFTRISQVIWCYYLSAVSRPNCPVNFFEHFKDKTSSGPMTITSLSPKTALSQLYTALILVSSSVCYLSLIINHNSSSINLFLEKLLGSILLKFTQFHINISHVLARKVLAKSMSYSLLPQQCGVNSRFI